MIRYFVLSAVLALPGLVEAQFRVPPPPMPALTSPIDGRWFFRGDRSQPCSIQTVATPVSQMLVFTNEKGTPAGGWMSRDGRRVTIPDWNLVGRVRGNQIVWPNGDFWSR